MYIKEVRNIIEDYNEKELKVLIAEMYKAIPKKIKQEKDIDKLIQDINYRKKFRKSARKKKEEIDLDWLEYEIEKFVDYAYKQYYFAPNSYVHKSKRSKWRFEVKNFIKDLEIVAGEAEDNKIALELLTKIYEVLCYGCYYIIFSGSDPFRSVGMEQEELFGKIMSRLFAEGVSENKIQDAIKLMAANQPYSELVQELMNYLKTPDSRKIAIEQCNLLIKRIENGGLLTHNKLEKKHNREYYTNNKINVITELGFACYVALARKAAACEYFWQKYRASADEVKLYILLRLLYERGFKEMWVEVYEKAVGIGVEPRDKLQKMYKYINENQDFPEHM